MPTARMAHRDVVTAMAVSCDNTSLATGGADDAVHVWDICELLKQAPPLKNVGGNPHAGFIHAGAFDSQGRWLATGGEDGSVQVWDVQGGEPICSAGLGGPAIRALRFSADGRHLAVGTERTSALYSLDAVGHICDFVTVPADNAIYALAFVPGAEGPAYLAGDARGSIVRLGGGPPVPQGHWHQGAVRAVGISPDGRWLVSVGDDSNLIVTDLTAASDATRPPLHEHLGRIKSHAISRDGTRLATGGHESIRVWDTATWTVCMTLRGHRDEIWALDFSPDGRFLASGSRDATARVWNLSAGQPLCCLPCSNAVLAVQFGPDSRQLRVADAGPGGGIPSIHLATLRCVPGDEPARS
jgi:WD40 repeat protein